MSGGGNTTQVTKASPWKPAQPYLQGILGDAQTLYGEGGFSPTPYGGNRVAPLSGATQGAYGSIVGHGGASPWIDQAHAGVAGAMSGDAYNGMTRTDPRLAGMTSGKDIYRDLGAVKQQALGGAIPAAMSMFTGNGMTDSSAAMDTVGRAATEAVAPIDYQAWQQAQDRRLQAVGLDDQTRLQALGQQQQGQLGAAALQPGLQQASYLPAQMLAGIGGQRDAYNQSKIAADMQKWYEQQGQRSGGLQNYAGLISSIAGQGGVQRSSQPGPGMGATLGSSLLGGLGTFGSLAAIPGIGLPLAAAGGIGAGLAGFL